MSIGLVGRKVGMTQIFDESGGSVPVTVVEVEPNCITQIKTAETDGYEAIQVTTGKRKASRVTKPMKNHFAKAKVEAGNGLWEFRITDADKKVLSQLTAKTVEGEESEASSDDGSIALGNEVTVNLFQAGQHVDVTGTSIGKGFAGAVKRHNFRTQDATHGNSLSHRAPGSIGQNQSPGRVFKGKKMAGHMGNRRVTVQNLQVVRIDEDKNLILLKGAVPGAKNGYVVINRAVKKASKASEQA